MYIFCDNRNKEKKHKRQIIENIYIRFYEFLIAARIIDYRAFYFWITNFLFVWRCWLIIILPKYWDSNLWNERLSLICLRKNTVKIQIFGSFMQLIFFFRHTFDSLVDQFWMHVCLIIVTHFLFESQSKRWNCFNWCTKKFFYYTNFYIIEKKLILQGIQLAGNSMSMLGNHTLSFTRYVYRCRDNKYLNYKLLLHKTKRWKTWNITKNKLSIQSSCCKNKSDLIHSCNNLLSLIVY